MRKHQVTLVLLFSFMIGLTIGMSQEVPTVIKQKTNQQTVKQQRCMAANIFHEARGEGIEGMKAVAAVVANRVMSEGYPSTICEVVHQKYQFSWTADVSLRGVLSGFNKGFNGPTERYTVKDYLAYQDAYRIAQKPLMELSRAIPRGIKHYAHENVKNYWTRKMKVKYRVGKHVFYTKK